MKSVLRYTIFICLCCCSLYGYAKWSQDMFSRYNYSNYTNFPDFNQNPASDGYDADLLEAAIFFETNRQRAYYGVEPLKYEYNLEVSAHNHSYDMVEQDFFEHTNPYTNLSSSDRIEQTGLNAQMTAENIALAPVKSTYVQTARYLVEQIWMKSSGHRANILNAKLQYLGCGAGFYYQGRTVYVKATQNFMTPWRSNTSQRHSSQPTRQADSSSWTANELSQANTAYGCDYMSNIEKDVLKYINLARMYPKKFADLEVKPFLHPQGYGVHSTFPQYKQSLLNHLYSMEPMQALKPDYKYYQLAYCWAEESSRLGVRGHQRVNCPKGDNAECCAYGVYTAIDIVLQWLIDDPVPSLGHRKICLNSKYMVAGVAFMRHPTEDHVTVLNIK